MFGTPYGVMAVAISSGNFRRAISTASMCLGAVRLAYAGKEGRESKETGRRHDGGCP